MEVINLSYPELSNRIFTPSIMAIGFFDGIHIGHQKVILKAKEKAKKLGVKLSILTFFPHPREVIGYVKVPLITPLSIKLDLLNELGIDCLYIMNFSKEFAQLSPVKFVEDILLKLNPVEVVVGFDYSFGYKGMGNPTMLKNYLENNIKIHIIEPINYKGLKVSSTLIREKLTLGEIPETNLLLNRKYKIIGKVVKGEQIGRKIGFPTANIELLDQFIIPKNGVYLVEIILKNELYHGVINIGYKPTFKSNNLKKFIEVHIFDFSNDIYGNVVEILFLEFLRDERKFSSIDELKTQINNDIITAKKMIIEFAQNNSI